MVVVAKKDGSIRVTSDLSPLNKFVIPHCHPLPHIKDLLVKLGEMQWFFKINLHKGYFHIPLQPNSRHYTATLTPLGLMAYNRLPMGLKDVASAFQKCVSAMLKNCENTISFVEDILVYGKTHKDHDNALKKVLAALTDKQFCLNQKKCEFRRREITFLGLHITSSGIHPNPDRIASIKNAAPPITLKQTQSFLSAVNYLSEFIPHLADKAEPLRLLTQKGVPFIWGSNQDKSFQQLKDAISEKLEFAIFDPNVPTIITVDTSDIKLGAQLSQVHNGCE